MPNPYGPVPDDLLPIAELRRLYPDSGLNDEQWSAMLDQAWLVICERACFNPRQHLLAARILAKGLIAMDQNPDDPFTLIADPTRMVLPAQMLQLEQAQ